MGPHPAPPCPILPLPQQHSPLGAKSLWSQGDSSPQAYDLPHHFPVHQASTSWLSPSTGSASWGMSKREQVGAVCWAGVRVVWVEFWLRGVSTFLVEKEQVGREGRWPRATEPGIWTLACCPTLLRVNLKLVTPGSRRSPRRGTPGWISILKQEAWSWMSENLGSGQVLPKSSAE